MGRMTRLAAAGAGLALIAGVAVATPAVAATARTAATAGTAAPTDAAGTCAPGAGGLWSRLPADLRDDLRDARGAAPGEERRAAFEAIREGALAGEYGDTVQRVAEARPGLGAGLWRDAPEELRDDVRAALERPVGERREAFAEIARAAAAGEYGAAVQDRAEQVRTAPW